MSDHRDDDDVGELTVTGRSGCRISLEWRIPDFLSLDTENDAWFQSSLFTFYDARWYLIINPKESYNGRPDFLCLCLNRYESGPLTTTFHAMLGIRGADGVENRKEGLLRSNFEEDEEVLFSWDGFCTRSELRSCKFRLMPGNKLIISLDLESGERRGEKELQNCYHKLLAGGEDSDVLIKVQGKEFHAHRAILRARSPVFQAMFTHNMVEKQSGVVTLKDFDKESFPAFLEHVYTGSTDIISVGNVFSLFTSSDKYNLGTLKEACLKFFSSNVSEILKTVEWRIFMAENSIVANELLIKTFAKIDEKKINPT